MWRKGKHASPGRVTAAVMTVVMGVSVLTGIVPGTGMTAHAAQEVSTSRGSGDTVTGNDIQQTLSEVSELTGSDSIDVTRVAFEMIGAQTIGVGGKAAFSAYVEPGNATEQKVKWSVGGTDADAVKLYSDYECTEEVGTDETEILIVYAKGQEVGEATITVTATNGTAETTDDFSAECTVTVEAPGTMIITSDNFSDYFDTYGYLNDAVAEDSVLDFQGEFLGEQYSLIINKRVTVTSSSKPGAVFDSNTNDSTKTLVFRIVADADGTTVNNLMFVNARLDVQGAKNCSFNNLTMVNSKMGVGTGVGSFTLHEGATDAVVKDSYFENGGTGASTVVVGTGAHHVVFENNTAKVSGNAGIFFYASKYNFPADTVDPEYLTFRNNTFISENGASCTGISLYGMGNVIEGNNFIDWNGSVTQNTAGSSPSNSYYKNNTVDGSGTMQIAVDSTAEGNVTGGRLTVSAGAVVTDNISAGMDIYGKDARVRGNIINGDVTVSGANTEFTGNDVTGTISVSSKGNTISGNTVVSSKEYAVILSSTSKESNTTVQDNALIAAEKKGDDAVNPGQGEGNVIADNKGSIALQDEWIQTIEDVTFTGKEITPEVIVKRGNTVLAAGTDYTVGYSANVNAGTAAVTVTAAENSDYSGSASATFNILAADSAVITAPEAEEDLICSGSAQGLVTEGTADGGKMWYAIGDNAAEAPEFDGSSEAADKKWSTTVPAAADAGTYYVWYMVVGDANHNGTAPVCVEASIAPADKTDLNAAIAEAETYYNSIKDETIYAEVASVLKTAIDTANEVTSNDNAGETAVSNAITTINQAKADAEAGKKDADDRIAAAPIIEMIEALPDAGNVKTSDAEAITAAKEAYDALTDDQKAKISGALSGKLDACEEALISGVAGGLSGFEVITEQNRDSAAALIDAYDRLTGEERAALVKKVGRTGIKKLSDLERALKVADMIRDLKDAEEITLNDEKAVSTVALAYELLSDPQKAMVSEELRTALEAAEAKIEALKEIAALEAAKSAAVGKLQDYAATKALPDATQDEKKAYDDTVAAETFKINAAETKDAVTAALTDAKAAVDAVLAQILKGRADAAAAAEMTAADEALAEARAAAAEAVKAADAALADAYISKVDQNAVNAAKNTLASALEAADHLEPEVSAADKNAAAGTIADAVKALTDAADTANVNSAAARQEAAAAAARLAAAKETAVGRLEDYSEAKALADFEQDEKKAYDDVTAAETFKINAAETKEEVTAALADAKAAVDAALAKIMKDRADAAAAEAAAAEMTAADEALAAARTAAAEAVTAAYAALADTYISADDQNAINAAKNTLASAVEAAEGLAPETSAENMRAAAGAIMNAVKTLTEATDTANVNSAAAKLEEATAAAQLAAAKETAVERLEDYSEAKALADFEQDEKKAYDDTAAAEILKINAAETPEAVAAALTAAKKAVDDRLAGILKARADAAAAAAEMAAADQKLAAAKAYAELILAAAEDAAEDAYISDTDKQALSEATEAVNRAVKAADELTLDASAADKNAEAKSVEDAAKALEAAVDTTNANSEAARAKAEAKAAAEAQLEAARNAALERFEDYSEAKAKTDASAAETEVYNSAAASGRAAIMAAEDTQAVTAALKEAKRAVDEVIVKIEKDRAAAAAVTAAINALPAVDDISVSDREAITAVREAYEELTEDQKSKITEETILKLNDAEAALAVAEKYSNEWVKGKWYNKDGTRTYAGIGKWKRYSKGWKYVDSLGWYPKNRWQKIDGKWYFFDKEGYMEEDAYRQGCYLTKDGDWDEKDKAAGWIRDDRGWCYFLDGNDCLKNGWQKIDGKWYFFKEDGHAAQNEFIQGMWFNKNCIQSDPVKYDWYEDEVGWWYGAVDGWYAKNSFYIIDGVSYSFNRKGYCTNR